VSWLASHWSELGTLIGLVTTAVADAKRRKAKKEAARLAKELDLIRGSAKTKAAWE
jgi:hypothetical protein